MSYYELQGEIIHVGELQTFASGFTKREIVVRDDSKYPQEIKLEICKDNIRKLEPYRVGSNISVKFNLRGREYNGKWFTNLEAWDIVGRGASEQDQQDGMPEGDMPF